MGSRHSVCDMNRFGMEYGDDILKNNKQTRERRRRSEMWICFCIKCCPCNGVLMSHRAGKCSDWITGINVIMQQNHTFLCFDLQSRKTHLYFVVIHTVQQSSAWCMQHCRYFNGSVFVPETAWLAKYKYIWALWLWLLLCRYYDLLTMRSRF